MVTPAGTARAEDPAESTTILTEINHIHKEKAKEFLLILKILWLFNLEEGFVPASYL